MKKIKKNIFFIMIIMCLFAAVVTAASAADAKSCNHNWVEYLEEGAPCKGYTYYYICSKCSQKTTKEISATQPHKWKETYKDSPDCTSEGSYMAVCTVCQSIYKETYEPLGHDYIYASNNNATCTKDGTSMRTCQRCKDVNIVPDKGSALGHDFSGEWQLKFASTCITNGKSTRTCSRCTATESREEPLTSHSDNNKDYKCDICYIDLSPEIDSDYDDDNIIKDCSCKCHKGGIEGFFWKIGNFFARLFRIKSKQICTCGRYHF